MRLAPRYQKYYSELGKDTANIYKYLNFDQVESYVEAASSLDAPDSRLHRTFAHAADPAKI